MRRTLPFVVLALVGCAAPRAAVRTAPELQLEKGDRELGRVASAGLAGFALPSTWYEGQVRGCQPGMSCVFSSLKLTSQSTAAIRIDNAGAGITWEGGTYDHILLGSASGLDYYVGAELRNRFATSTGYFYALYGFTAATASGQNAYMATVNGARFDIGAGASDYLYSDGTNVHVASALRVDGLTAAPNTDLGADLGSGSLRWAYAYLYGFRPSRKALNTCGAGIENSVEADSAAGASTGKRTKLCLCTSDGAGSPTYAWQNLATGTIGNTTTCGTE